MKTLFVTNPGAGRQKNREALDEKVRRACASLSMEPDVRTCSRIEDLDGIIAAAVDGGFECVCAVGGDGTVHEVGRRLVGTPLILGILPVGSGNGLARHLRIPVDFTQALRTLVEGHPEAIDTGRVDDSTFLGVFGTGFDAEVAHRFAASGSRGLETYIVEGLRSYASYSARRYRLTVDGERFEEEAFVIAVANSGQYGNEARIAPRASLRDGLLDVTIVHEAPLLSVPFLLTRLFAGTLHETAQVHMLRGREIVLERPEPGPAHLDGEPVMLPATLHFSVQPLSLRIMVPRGVEEF
ncbi:MAG TPA: diacylglycerol kinase family protein [Thermoanaerobaculia bacterium]|nr:diacylglycerol kinase family protein [Thermoanaerobaculia bacterium]